MKRIRVLGLLLLSVFGFVGFSSASSITIISPNSNGYKPGSVLFSKTLSTKDFVFDYTCNGSCGLQIKNGYNLSQHCTFQVIGGGAFVNSTCGDLDIFSSDYFVFDVQDGYFSSITITGLDLSSSCPECPSCPSTGDILSGYIAISDITTNYCVSNDLCPESTGYSTLMINDIRHESMPFINITIPEEFNWDYNYTGNNTQFDLFINGYNTDSSYIEGIINTQNSKPNSTDFSNIIGGLLPLLVPGLIIILFIYFIFKFIKKIF